MSVIDTWVCLLLWVTITTQEKTPEVHVTCTFSEECLLPCTFQPANNEVIRWFRQEVVVFSFLRNATSEEQSEHEHYMGRASLSPPLVSHGNATLILRSCGPKDRGRYRCHVRTSAGVHEAYVIVKVEAPINVLTLELSRLSGYEEIKCAIRNVYPAPHVTWATDPPTKALKPITRKLADRQGLYTVESRLRKLEDQSELLYICKVNSSYGTKSWTASFREREIIGTEGSELTIPCHAPPYLRNPSLSWNFTNGNKPVEIFTYNSLSQHTSALGIWKDHIRLDAVQIQDGDGSLQLTSPDQTEHDGMYTCVYSDPQNTHTEHIGVMIIATDGQHAVSQPFQWWIVALVLGVLVLTLLAILGHLKVKGNHSKPSLSPEQVTELKVVKDAPVDENLSESSPLTAEDTNGHSAQKSGSPVT